MKFKKIILVLLLFVCSEGLSQSIYDKLSDEEKIYGLSKLWKEIEYNFAFIDQLNFDLDSLYMVTIPKVVNAKNNFEYIAVLSAFMKNFNDGHTAVWTNQFFWDEADYPPLEVKKERGKYLVSKIDESLVDRIPIHSEVLSVDGEDYESASKSRPYGALLGYRDSTSVFTFKTPKGEFVEELIKRNYNASWKKDPIKMVPNFKSIGDKKAYNYQLKNNISILTLNSFRESIIVDSFKTDVKKINMSKALIIDVRENGGGNGDYALELAKHLVKKNYVLTPSWKTRTHNAAQKAWASLNITSPNNPYAKKYKDYYNTYQWEEHQSDSIYISTNIEKIEVPILILIGENTYSAAEDFLIYLASNENIKFIGENSAGSSGQPLTVELPGGSMAKICAKRDALPDGKDYINIGIEPDIKISKDEDALVFALQYLKN